MLTPFSSSSSLPQVMSNTFFSHTAYKTSSLLCSPIGLSPAQLTAMPAHWPDRNHTRYSLVRARVISDRVSLAASHHSITSELSPVLLLRSPAAANWKQIVMKALFTPHLLHFSQICPHFPPWFNSNGITCTEMLGKASHSMPGVSLSHSSSLWQLSDMPCRAHRYKVYIHLRRTVAGKRLEAAQIPAATTCWVITLHGNESKRQLIPERG